MVFETFLSVHFAAFGCVSVHFRSVNIVLVLHHDSGNGHDLLIKFSERSDLDNPYPKGVLNGKMQKKWTFFTF